LEEDGWLRYDEVHMNLIRWESSLIHFHFHFHFLILSHFISQKREIERLFLQIDDSKRLWKKTDVNKDYEVQKLCPYAPQPTLTHLFAFIFILRLVIVSLN
jgi:hypothetical protein